MVSLAQHNSGEDGARKEREDGVASVVQSTSGDTSSVDASNKTNPPQMADAAPKIDKSPSTPTVDPPSTISSAGPSKQTTKKK